MPTPARIVFASRALAGAAHTHARCQQPQPLTVRSLPLLSALLVLCWTAAALRPDDDFSKLRVKQLKELLMAYGEGCEGCVEKRDFEQKLREVVVAAQEAR